MSEADAEEPAELDRPVQLRRCAVLFGTDPENPVPDPDYPIGVLELVDEEVGVTATVAVASICEIDNRVLVAVPFEAWHRLLAKRRLPPDTFLKATPVTLGFCDRASSSSEILDQRKCWLGFLSPLGEQLAKYEDGEVAVEPDVSFDPTSPSVLPEAYQLVAAAEHHFIYASATSGQAEASSRKAPKAAVEDRLSILEATLQEVASGLKQLTEAKRPSALKQPAVTFSGPPTVVDPTSGPCGFPPGLTRPPVVGVGALDADVVQSARAAGVPEDQIAEMARLAMRGKTKLQDLPAPRSRARSSQNPLSESEDEEVEQEEDQGGASGTEPTQLVAAVTQLTKIASHLTNQKKKGQTLDALLDGAGSASTSEGGIPSGSRRYAVALKALRRTLTKNPQEIYQAIEKNMETDFIDAYPSSGKLGGGCQLEGLVGNAESGAKLCHSTTPPLGHCWCFGLSSRRSCLGGTCKVLPAVGSRRSAFDRPWKLVGFPRDSARRRTASRSFLPACPPYGHGAASHKAHRREVGGSLFAEDQRLRRLGREEEEAGSQALWGSRGRFPCNL